MKRRQILWHGLKLLDMGVMSTCFAVAAYLVFPSGGPRTLTAFLSIRVSVLNVLLFGLLLAMWHLIFAFLGLYRSQRLQPAARELSNGFLATVLSSGVLALWSRSGNVELVSTRFVGLFFVTSSAAFLLGRVALRFFLRRVRARGRNLRHLVIVGTNPRAVELGRHIVEGPELGYKLRGFADNSWPGENTFHQSGFEIIVDLAGLQTFLRQRVVDEVVICLPVKSMYRESSKIVEFCQKMGVTVRFHFELFGERADSATALPDVTEPLVTVYSNESAGWAAYGKRLTDIVVSGVLIVLLAPVLLFIAALVKLTAPGAAFFVQERLGRGRRRFPMYKFRSMRPNAESMLRTLEAQNEVDGPVFKMEHDPRVTPLGGFLRRTSLDELPQLFNVLKGEMSLVGPRPLPARDYAGFTEDWHRRRFSVRPGITCLWQISGRSSTTFEKWMELDLEYIDKWTFWLDMKILWRTIPAVVKGSGAV